jgi:hypothetical protein
MFYQKPEDSFVLSEIQNVLKERPTYGYKRIAAMVNRNLAHMTRNIRFLSSLFGLN